MTSASKPESQHETAREWWADPVMETARVLNYTDGVKEYVIAELYVTPRYDDLIHLREVLPGEITITREEFIAAVGGLMDSDTLADVLDEVFGPEPTEGQQG